MKDTTVPHVYARPSPQDTGTRRPVLRSIWGPAMSRDHRDLALEQFADDERQLLERLASVEDDRDIYREMVQVTLQQLHDLTQSHQQLREQRDRLRDENRRLRAHLLTKSLEAA